MAKYRIRAEIRAAGITGYWVDQNFPWMFIFPCWIPLCFASTLEGAKTQLKYRRIISEKIIYESK